MLDRTNFVKFILLRDVKSSILHFFPSVCVSLTLPHSLFESRDKNCLLGSFQFIILVHDS